MQIDHPESDASSSLVFQFASSNDSASDAVASGASTPGSFHTPGVGGWLERAHNVEIRSEVPQLKRRKLEEDAASSKVNGAARAGGSILGSYVKEKIKEGSSTPKSDTQMVDLTACKMKDIQFMATALQF